MMKNLFSLCFILFFFCTNSAAQESSAVIDRFGNELKVGSKYYIAPAMPGRGGGGFEASYFDTLECNDTVSLTRCDDDLGMPVTFHPASPEETVIHLSKSLNIKFETSVPPCANSTVWQAMINTWRPDFTGTRIRLEGALGNPGCETAHNWFKIEKGSRPGWYKLVYNPDDVCSIYNTKSYDLYSWWAFGMRPVAFVRDYPLQVEFINYDDSNLYRADVFAKRAYA